MIIDCVSDLHGFYPELEGGDLLIMAGDMTRKDEPYQYIEFLSWLHKQEYKRYVVIAGNHDNLIQKEKIFGNNLAKTDYLLDSGTEFEMLEDQECNWCKTPREGSPWIKCAHSEVCPLKVSKKVKIWGSPWTKSFPGMNPKFKAFTLDTEEELAKKWELIPNDIDILITHSPPYDILDVVKDYTKGKMICCGSQTLLIKTCIIKPKLHIFGHIHEGYGEIKFGNSTFVNASHVNEYYEPVNKPIRIVL